MLPEDNRWFMFALEDLRMADLAFEEEIFNQVCFHAQQAAEKMLKGCIADREESVPRTHKLTDLIQVVDWLDLAELRDQLMLLDRFYIPSRYPDALPGTLPDGLPSHDDAHEARQTAVNLRIFLEASQDDEDDFEIPERSSDISCFTIED